MYFPINWRIYFPVESVGNFLKSSKEKNIMIKKRKDDEKQLPIK